MIKTGLTFLILMAFLTVSGQSTIHIPFGSTPTIDGTIASNEWSSSDSIFIPILSNTRSVKVLYMHDSTNLHFAFIGNLESTNTRFPEILLDINNDKNATWLPDDWWFHASATDCESQGKHSNYDSCQVVRHNWTAERNFLQNTPVTDTVEIQIPFTTIHLDLANQDTIGIAFDVTNTFNSWEFWPTTTDIDQPSTWANAVFLAPGTNSNEKMVLQTIVDIYPNPSTGQFTLKLHQSKGNDWRLEIHTALGHHVYSEHLRSNINTEITVNPNLSKGIYLVTLKSRDQVYVGKVVIQ